MSYAHRLEGERKIKLKDFDAGEDGGLERVAAEEKTARFVEELIELQELLYAAQMQSVLIILQGRDTSGKDGTISHVAGPLNSQGCAVSSFKVPTEEELAHDFLWRVHAQTPTRGHIKIFNRSHYEDVLVVRVHELAPEKVWRERYEHINAFERLLTDSSTIILKFYLHISKDEQKKRLLKRETDPIKSWKLSVGDWNEREYWDNYTIAYEDVLNRCSTKHAPWFIVPADKKWFRNLAVAEALRDELMPFREKWLKKLEEVGREKRNYDADRLRATGGNPGLCWSCAVQLVLPPRIRVGRQVLMLNHDTQLFPHHTDDDQLYDFSLPTAAVTRHPSNASIWGLKNLSDNKWVVTTADSAVRDVEPQRSVTLAVKTRIQFGRAEGEIRV